MAQSVTPPMADLPKERLSFQSPPFTSTGVDYFGPFYVSVRRSTEKRFLFTCLTTPAVHFEIVPSMDTYRCVMGIERVIARRGAPVIIWSDNGTNFVGAEKELLQFVQWWDQVQICTSMVQKGIRWKFNPPAAPHHGGSCERLVRSSKWVFYAVVGSRRLTDEILSNMFRLVEQILNARPLFPAGADPNDLTALTPNHFLLGRSAISPSCIPLTDNGFNHRKRYVRAQSYANAVWSRWLKEYVPDLKKRTKWNSSAAQKLKSGDLVWVVEATSPRGFIRWPESFCFAMASTVSLAPPNCVLLPVPWSAQSLNSFPFLRPLLRGVKILHKCCVLCNDGIHTAAIRWISLGEQNLGIVRIINPAPPNSKKSWKPGEFQWWYMVAQDTECSGEVNSSGVFKKREGGGSAWLVTINMVL